MERVPGEYRSLTLRRISSKWRAQVFFRSVESRKAPVDPAESLEVIAFLEAANASRRSGEWVSLDVG